MPAEIWLVLNSGPGDPAFNMAIDEALLLSMPRLNRPVLRFYTWTLPAASFGYFQHYKDVEQLTPLRPLVRRPTGGGIVPHDADWTYSLIFPVTHSWYGLNATESYRCVHEWIKASFALVHLGTELAANARKAAPGQCFVGFEQSDVLCQGQKIAGAAQRRTRAGLLIQGSVQPPLGAPSRSQWQEAMCRHKESRDNIQWQTFTPDAELDHAVSELVAGKYANEAYNRKR